MPFRLCSAFINNKQELIYGGNNEMFIKCLAEDKIEEEDKPIHTQQRSKFFLHVSPCSRFYHIYSN